MFPSPWAAAELFYTRASVDGGPVLVPVGRVVRFVSST